MAEAHHDLSRLEGWLTALAQSPVHVVSRAMPKTGFSAETMILSVNQCGAGRDIVLRIGRVGRDMFLDAGIGRQAQMMHALARHGIPVPPVIGWSDDADILGAPFLVMERGAGLPLPQHPSYHQAGLLIGLNPGQRAAAWQSALSTMARINRIDWRDDFGFLLEPAYGEPGLDHYLGWVRAWRGVAHRGDHRVIDAALDWLDANRPAGMPVELLWGDSNPGNFLFAADGLVSVVLDFEAAAIGPAEIDLAWWIVVDRMLAAGHHLPGLPDTAGQIAIFVAALGRPVRHLAYFEVLAALRMAIVIANIARLLIAAGTLPADNRAAILNPASAMLAQMIGGDHRDGHPDGLGDYMAMVGVMNARQADDP